MVSDQPVFAKEGLLKYAATSGRAEEAFVVPTTLPSSETVTCVGVVPSCQSAAQPLAMTFSPGRTIDDPAALLTLSSQPMGGLSRKDEATRAATSCRKAASASAT